MSNLLNASKIFLKNNGSTILAIVASAGVVMSSVAAAKATPKAMKLLEKAQKEKGEELTTLEKIRTAGPAYIPAVAIGASTIACIFGANALNKRNQASLMSAYALLDSSYKEYKKKVKEMYGDESETNIKRELAKDIYEGNYISAGGEKKLFFDFFSMNYFESTDQAVMWAEKRVNELLQTRGYVALLEFYEMLGINMNVGFDLGWSRSSCSEVRLLWENETLDDGLECCILSFVDEPSTGFVY